MKAALLEILACPQCQGKLLLNTTIDTQMDYLVCEADQLGFRVEDGIPVLLVEEAKDLKAS